MDCSGLSMSRCPTAEILDHQTKDLNAIDPKTGKQGGCYSPCMKLTDDKWNPKGTAVAADSAVAGPYCCAGASGSPGTCKGNGAASSTQPIWRLSKTCVQVHTVTL